MHCMAFNKEFSSLCAMFLFQIISSFVIWCLKITHTFVDISLYCSLHWDWSSKPSKRTQEEDTVYFPMTVCRVSPAQWRRPQLLKCKIRRFRTGNSFHYVLSPMVLLFQNCCLLSVCVQVSYKQLRPYIQTHMYIQGLRTKGSFHSLAAGKYFPLLKSIFLPFSFNYCIFSPFLHKAK